MPLDLSVNTVAGRRAHLMSTAEDAEAAGLAFYAVVDFKTLRSLYEPSCISVRPQD